MCRQRYGHAIFSQKVVCRLSDFLQKPNKTVKETKKFLEKGQSRKYCDDNLAIVDISTNSDDGWIGHVSMTDEGDAAEYSCTNGCISLTGDILSEDKTIIIDKDRVSLLT